MSILGPIASAECTNESNNLCASFETSGRKRPRDYMRDKWIACNDDMSARHQYPHQALGPQREERFEVFKIR
jgi:hypothetical protein